MTKKEPKRLKYDEIIKKTLQYSDEVTIRFINGLLGDDLPLNAKIEWLDTESIEEDKRIADFYIRIDNRMYHIETEQSDNGDMALRMFRYGVRGAIRHNMETTDKEINITFPKPCIIFLKSKKSTPKELKWNINYFDGQKITPC